MKLNWQENRGSRLVIPSDFLRLISREMLLGNLISKSVAEALDELLIDLKISERSLKTILFYRDRLKWFVHFIKPNPP